MSLILSLDTSSTGCSVALHDSGKILGTVEIHQENTQGARLALLIKQVLDNTGFKSNDLKAVAVSSGPGSYTGLRIGTSTAKGVCVALGIPLLAVDSLSLMTLRVMRSSPSNTLYCPMLDARRMEVYCAVQNEKLEFIEPIQAKVIDSNSFADVLEKQPMVFFGNGASKCRELIRHTNASFIDEIYPSAFELGHLAYSKFEKGLFEDLVHFEPQYLKEFLIKKSTKMDTLLNK